MQIDVGGIRDIAMAGTSATLLARKWESALLVNRGFAIFAYNALLNVAGRTNAPRFRPVPDGHRLGSPRWWATVLRPNHLPPVTPSSRFGETYLFSLAAVMPSSAQRLLTTVAL